MSEWSKVLLSCFIIYLARLFSRHEITEVYSSLMNSNIRDPFFMGFVPRHAFETASIVCLFSSVHFIFCMRTLSQIIPAIVQCIVILVIALFFLFAAKNYPVHSELSYTIRFSDMSDGIKTSSAREPNGIPIPFGQPFKITGIYDGILSLRKGNQSVGLIKRLNNLVPVHGGFHWSSSQGLLKLSRYSIAFGE